MLILSVIPLYLISIPVGFSLGKSVSMGIGIVGSLLSALLVTGLGDFIWKFLPWGWGVRFMDYCVLRYVNEGQFHSNLPEFQLGFILMLFFTVVLFIISLVWFQRWEGAKEGDYSREQCYLNKENVTQFSYKGNDYTILADTISNSELGEWIGYIRQLAAVDESGKILLQENLKTATFQTLADLADLVDKAPNDAYIIPFLNVYAAPNADDYLIVDINGEYHKAVIDENIKGTDTVFDFKDIEQSMSGKFEINPQNATQLLCDGTVYQVTSDTVSNNELGSYIGILAENVIFNAETKIPLSKEELRKIDWYGENAGQHREQWIYKDIYEIHGTEKTEAVAVQINDRYYIAKRQ